VVPVTLDPSLVRVLIVAARWRKRTEDAMDLAQAIRSVCDEAKLELHPRQLRHILESQQC